MKLGHVAVSVRDLIKSAGFYRRCFGLLPVKKYSYPDKGMRIWLLRKGEICLELFELKNSKPLPVYRKTLASDLHTLGVKHFSLELKDIKSYYDKFKRAKVGFATDLRVFDNGLKYFFIKDPDGSLIEIMEAAK